MTQRQATDKARRQVWLVSLTSAAIILSLAVRLCGSQTRDLGGTLAAGAIAALLLALCAASFRTYRRVQRDAASEPMTEAERSAPAAEDTVGPGPYTVGLGGFRVVAWIAMILFGGLAIGAFLAHRSGPAWLFLGCAGLGAAILAFAGPITFDRDGVTQRCLFGTFALGWRDLRRIETGAGGLVLIGEQTRVVIPPPSCWSGQEKADAWALLGRAIAATGIVPSPRRTAGYRWHRNARVRRP